MRINSPNDKVNKELVCWQDLFLSLYSGSVEDEHDVDDVTLFNFKRVFMCGFGDEENVICDERLQQVSI